MLALLHRRIPFGSFCCRGIWRCHYLETDLELFKKLKIDFRGKKEDNSMSLTKRHNKIAHKMTKFLRYDGKDFVASDGFAEIDDLIREISNPNSNITPEDIHLIVKSCEKERFTIESSKIRCNQGHSINMPVPDLETTEITLKNIGEVGVCAHGTTQDALTKIQESESLTAWIGITSTLQKRCQVSQV